MLQGVTPHARVRCGVWKLHTSTTLPACAYMCCNEHPHICVLASCVCVPCCAVPCFTSPLQRRELIGAVDYSQRQQKFAREQDVLAGQQDVTASLRRTRQLMMQNLEQTHGNVSVLGAWLCGRVLRSVQCRGCVCMGMTGACD
jgi:hypothetical protein